MSVRFDPFSHVALPLPGSNLRTIKCHFVPRSGARSSECQSVNCCDCSDGGRPVLFNVSVSSTGTMWLLKEQLAERASPPFGSSRTECWHAHAQW